MNKLTQALMEELTVEYVKVGPLQIPESVVISWVMFDLSTVSHITTFIKSMFGGSGVLIDDYARYQFHTYVLIFLLCALSATSFGKWLLEKARRSKRLDQILCVLTPVAQMGLFVLCIAYLVNETYNPFLYFRF